MLLHVIATYITDLRNAYRVATGANDDHTQHNTTCIYYQSIKFAG